MHDNAIFAAIQHNNARYLDFLCRLCAFEARAYDKQTLDRMADYITEFAEAEGFQVFRTPFEACGDFLTIDLNPGAPKCCVLMAHMDTVHEKGTFGTPPVQVLEDRIIAPGAIDCKGGIAVALLAMKALLDQGYPNHVRLILTSDEEISNTLGGAQELQFFRDSTQGFPCAINCETTENDEVVVSRKGIIKYQLEIKGVGGHSGIHYFECKNAILEAAHKIVALHSRSTPSGITYSCNIIGGGTVGNIIPEFCSVLVDVRVVTHEDIQKAEQTLREIAETSFISGTSTELIRKSIRPPMERTEETMALFRTLLEVTQQNGLGSLTPVGSGGGSDSCYTQAAGIPSICGMGPSGEFCHTTSEYVKKDTVALRAKILAAFCCRS